MAKVRVYELAKDVGMDSKDVLAKLQEMGEFVRSASSTVEAPVVRKFLEKFPAVAATPKKAPVKKAPAKKPAAKKAVAKKPAAKKKSVARKPAAVAAPVVKTVLNPAAAWPFPTGSRP